MKYASCVSVSPPRPIVVFLVTAIVLLVAGGTLGLARWRSPSGESATSAARLDTLAPRARPAAEATGERAKGPGVTPTPPSVMAVASGPVPDETRRALAGLARVEKLLTVDAGAVSVRGARLNLLAVDPADFRSWTPKAVAAEPALWRALTRGELVADPGTVRRFGLLLGASYRLDSGPRLRVAASAALGLRGVDGIVSTETGRDLGLARDVVVLLHGGAGEISAAQVARTLGGSAQVLTLNTPKAERPPQTAREVAVRRPGDYLELYKSGAAYCPGLSWTVLAAIGQVESSHGRDNGPSSAGALGPMQFMPSTWAHYGVDGDGDGVKDVWNPYDAVPGAAAYLCASGAPGDLRRAVYAYNHSWSYVERVLALAAAYARDYP